MHGLQELTAPFRTEIDKLVYQSQDEVSLDLVKSAFKHEQYDNQALLETAFRNTFYKILATCRIDDAEFSAMWRLIDIVSFASDAELCDPGLPFLLVEELLDSQTIHGCRKVFDYLEARRERMTAKHWKAKHLVILRSCNELLRRLSRAEDTVFCGRVFIFLFQSFPLGDKSSVNLRGEYHTDNVTQFDQAVAEASSETMEVDGNVDSSAPPTIRVEGKETVDTGALYPTFWALQEYFAQPTKLFEASKLESFKTGLQTTLNKFKEVYRDEPRSNAQHSDESQGTKRKLDNPDGDNFNPRYLTSRDLFDLEIHDPAFRRHILVQALIAVDFLLSQTPKAKSRLENMKNKSVIYDFVLDEKDAQWASGMRGEIAAYLQQGSEGKFYYRMVDTVLLRDKNWLRWKAESCPPFQLDPVDPQSYVQGREGIESAAAPRRIRKAPMAALDVSFLDPSKTEEDPLARWRDPAKWKKPDLESLRGAIQDAQFDIDMARDDEERKAAEDVRSGHVWRALRRSGRFEVFDKLDDGNNMDPLFGIESEGGGDEAKEEDDQNAGASEVQIDDDMGEEKDGDQEGDDRKAEDALGGDSTMSEGADKTEHNSEPKAAAGQAEETTDRLREDSVITEEGTGAEQVDLIGDGVSSVMSDAVETEG